MTDSYYHADFDVTVELKTGNITAIQVVQVGEVTTEVEE